MNRLKLQVVHSPILLKSMAAVLEGYSHVLNFDSGKTKVVSVSCGGLI